MKIIVLVSFLSLFVSACSQDDNETSVNKENTVVATFDKQQEVENAKQITQQFAGALKTELMTAMNSGGPVAAINVCNKKAIPITEQLSKQHAVEISRISLKNRNPDNQPSEWQIKILEDFDKRAAQGEDIKTMAFTEIKQEEGNQQLHFLKALPTAGLCLTCHGTELAPDVKSTLAELYPEDKAVGYSVNQVRGAVVIRKTL